MAYYEIETFITFALNKIVNFLNTKKSGRFRPLKLMKLVGLFKVFVI